MDEKLKIKVIIGSTRQNRYSEKPAYWIYGELAKEAGVEAEILDLRDYPMPFLESAKPPSASGGKYEDEVTQKWAAKINEADAYIVVSPEYNHGYPAVLKNAIDALFHEWARKPIGFVSYGAVGGARAVEQLRLVVIELQMFPIRNSIAVPAEVYMKTMGEKVPVDPELFAPIRNGRFGDHLGKFFSQLIWSARVLKVARESESDPQH